jgi:hypothetical protein
MAGLEAAVGNLAERRMSEGGTRVASVSGVVPEEFNYSPIFVEELTMQLRIKRGVLQQLTVKREMARPMGAPDNPPEQIWKDVPYVT